MGVTGGHVHGSGWSSSTQAFPPLGSHPPVFPSGIHERDNRRMPALAQPELGQRDHVVPDSPIGMGGSSPSVVPQCTELGDLGGECGLQGGIAGLRRNYGVVPDGKTSDVGKVDSFPDGLVVKRNARVVPLSGDEGMSHPEGMSSGVPLKGIGQKVTGTMYLLGMYVTGEVFGLNDAAVLTPAIAGVASPADLAGTGVPVVNGMEFPAIAEDLSLADDAGGCP